jgi:hypothetical protein
MGMYTTCCKAFLEMVPPRIVGRIANFKFRFVITTSNVHYDKLAKAKLANLKKTHFFCCTLLTHMQNVKFTAGGEQTKFKNLFFFCFFFFKLQSAYTFNLFSRTYSPTPPTNICVKQ